MRSMANRYPQGDEGEEAHLDGNEVASDLDGGDGDEESQI